MPQQTPFAAACPDSVERLVEAHVRVYYRHGWRVKALAYLEAHPLLPVGGRRNRMNIQTVRDFFMWCSILNGTLLVLSTAILAFAGDWAFRRERSGAPYSFSAAQGASRRRAA
ncbi:MAG: hypothetical protein FJ224_09095 [Lentisphaerae bacterium]|nr:hypothetical protein [Lentisphaerota bacterium]